jgi:K+ transporter
VKMNPEIFFNVAKKKFLDGCYFCVCITKYCVVVMVTYYVTTSFSYTSYVDECFNAMRKIHRLRDTYDYR